MSACNEDGYPLDPQHPWNRDTRSTEQTRAEAAEAKIEGLRRAYRDGNLGALEAALVLCTDHPLPLPPWIIEGLRESLKRDQHGDSTGRRGHKTWVHRYADDMADLDRYEAVVEGRALGESWKDVYDEVSELIYGHTGHAHTIEAAYKRVSRRLKTEPGRYAVLRFRRR